MKLDEAKNDPEKVSLTAAARAVETVEKVYSHSDENKDLNVRSFADRLKWLQAVTAELARRGETDADVIDAEIVEDPGVSEN